MAVATVDSDATNVMRMAELNRLLDEVVLACVVARQMQHGDHATKRRQKQDDRQNAQPGVSIGVALEDEREILETTILRMRAVGQRHRAGRWG